MAQTEPTASTDAGTDRVGRRSHPTVETAAAVAADSPELRRDAAAPAAGPAATAAGADRQPADAAAGPGTAAAAAASAVRRRVRRPDAWRRAQAGSDCPSPPPAVAVPADAPAWAGAAAPAAPGRSADPRRGAAASAARCARSAAARPDAQASAVQAPAALDVRSTAAAGGAAGSSMTLGAGGVTLAAAGCSTTGAGAGGASAGADSAATRWLFDDHRLGLDVCNWRRRRHRLRNEWRRRGRRRNQDGLRLWRRFRRGRVDGDGRGDLRALDESRRRQRGRSLHRLGRLACRFPSLHGGRRVGERRVRRHRDVALARQALDELPRHDLLDRARCAFHLDAVIALQEGDHLLTRGVEELRDLVNPDCCHSVCFRLLCQLSTVSSQPGA